MSDYLQVDVALGSRSYPIYIGTGLLDQGGLLTRHIRGRQDGSLFEHASEKGQSWYWQQWMFRRSYLLVPAQAVVGQFLASFEEFPPRSLPASFSVGDALKSLETASQGQ